MFLHRRGILVYKALFYTPLKNTCFAKVSLEIKLIKISYLLPNKYFFLILSIIIIFKIYFIYLFLAALGLHCCT